MVLGARPAHTLSVCLRHALAEPRVNLANAGSFRHSSTMGSDANGRSWNRCTSQVHPAEGQIRHWAHRLPRPAIDLASAASPCASIDQLGRASGFARSHARRMRLTHERSTNHSAL